MGLVRVVTDGGADLPSDLADSLGIAVVRGPVLFGGVPWTGSTTEFWAQVRGSDATPTTSPPGVDALREAFVGEAPVCAVHVSGELSETEERARQAAGEIGEHDHVVDSRSLSIGTGLLAMTAAQAARAGVEFDELKTLLRSLVDRLHVHGVISAVDFLVRGGRAGLLDTRKLKHGASQIIAVKGHAIPLQQAKSRGRAIDALLDHIEGHANHGFGQWAVAHGDSDDVGEFVAKLETIFEREPQYVVPLGPSVGAHAGPDALVVGFVSAEGEH
jgi:DegV family protein with EDD domain